MSTSLFDPLEWDKKVIQSCLGDWFGKAKAYIHGGPCFAFANTTYHKSEQDAKDALEFSIKCVEESL